MRTYMLYSDAHYHHNNCLLSVTRKAMGDPAEADGQAAVPSPSKELIAYLQHLQGAIQPLTRAAAQLPGPSDLSFHKSLDRRLGGDLIETRESIVATVRALHDKLPDASRKGKAHDQHADDQDGFTTAKLLDETGFATLLGDVIDTLLENTDTCLDEYQGRVVARPAERQREAAGRLTNLLPQANGPLPANILNAPIRPPPQAKFSKQADNSRETSWRHSLQTKPNAKVPLSWQPPSSQPGEAERHVGTRQGIYCAEGDPMENPYFHEITTLKAPAFALEVPALDDLGEPSPLHADDPAGGPVPFLWIHNEATFDALCEHLKEERVKEIAIDVEHHNYHSYQGLVCLVQISTRWQDFIIDGLSPSIRDISYKLNDVMTDPSKVKILHGAEHDVLWLQRDLNIYLVGLFDTYHATNVLNFTQHSLAYLLQKYIEFIADKRYQLADWRIRPLPAPMLFYARSDTHWLIHVYDCMRFEIAKTLGNLAIAEVFELSKRTAAKTYAKEEWDSAGEGREGWRTMWKKLANDEAIGVDARWEKGGVDGLTCTERIFRSLHNWRDVVARSEDESTRFILSSAHMLNLASRAPTSQEAVLPCIGQAFKRRSGELAELIEREKRAFAAVQDRYASIQREVLSEMNNDEGNDELGTVVQRPATVASTLWPEAQSDAAAKALSVDSSMANLLFPAQFDEGSSTLRSTRQAAHQRQSLFTPPTSSSSAQARLSAIRLDLATALRGLLGEKDDGKTAAIMKEDEDMQPLQPKQTNDAEADAAQDAIQSVTAYDEGEKVGNEAAKKEAVATSIAENESSNIIQSARKKKRSKNREKGRATAGSGSPDADSVQDGSAASLVENGKHEKKRRWTKEEKEARKAAKSSSGQSVEPFDYSDKVSVLDRKPDGIPEKQVHNDGRKKERQAQGAATKDKGGPSKAAAKGRYSNVPVGRDRREQAGGKSMTFSK